VREYGNHGDAPGHVSENSRGDLLAPMMEYLEARDIAGLTKGLLRLAKVLNPQGVFNNPQLGEYLGKLRDLLARLYGLLHSSDLIPSPKDLSDIAFALGKLQYDDNIVVDILQRIAEISKYRAENFSPHDMAGIVWGFASLGVRNEALMSVIAAEVVNKIEGFDQRHLSNTAWAFSKCGLWNEQLVSAIAGECLAKIHTFSAQSLSHISWAMAQWGTRKDDLMNAIADEVQHKTHEFSPGPLAMTAWSFASLQIKNIPLMTSISEEAVDKIRSFKTQDLAHLAWAFANLRIQDSRLFNKMADEVQRNINGTLPPELANIAWAFSKNNFSHEDLMCAIAKEAVSQIHNFKSAEVAMLTWAFAVAGLRNKELMTGIGAQVAQNIIRFSAPQLSHIAWAFGALSLRHTEFLQSLSTHVYGSIKSFRAQGLSNIAWAFAMVNFRDEQLILRVAPAIAREVGDLRPLALARCAWAYRVLSVPSPELMDALSVEALKKADEFPTKALVKLIDSVYSSPVPKERSLLHRVLAGRTADVANFIQAFWKGNHPINEEDYCGQLHAFSFVECGIVGTPLLLSQLNIDLPSGGFMRRCCQKGLHRNPKQDPTGQATDDASRVEYTAAEATVTLADRTFHEWFVRYPDDFGQDCLSVDDGGAQTFLVACTLPGRQGRHETTFAVLEDICSKILDLGVQSRSVEDCAAVTGSVEIFSSVIPCLSSVGAMWQFRTRFPNVTLEFAEQVGSISD